MVRSRSLVPLTVSLAVISAFACISRRAEACGVAYPPYVTLVDATPAELRVLAGQKGCQVFSSDA